MGWKFKRRVKILPGITVNVGKKSSSISLGGKGFSYNIGAKGTRTTVSLPGSGLSYSTYKKHANSGKGARSQTSSSATEPVSGGAVIILVGFIVSVMAGIRTGSGLVFFIGLAIVLFLAMLISRSENAERAPQTNHYQPVIETTAVQVPAQTNQYPVSTEVAQYTPALANEAAAKAVMRDRLQRACQKWFQDNLDQNQSLANDISEFIENGLIRPASAEEKMNAIYSVEVLKDLLRIYGLKVSGSKQILIQRLVEHVKGDDLEKLTPGFVLCMMTDEGRKVIYNL